MLSVTTLLAFDFGKSVWSLFSTPFFNAASSVTPI